MVDGVAQREIIEQQASDDDHRGTMQQAEQDELRRADREGSGLGESVWKLE